MPQNTDGEVIRQTLQQDPEPTLDNPRGEIRIPETAIDSGASQTGTAPIRSLGPDADARSPVDVSKDHDLDGANPARQAGDGGSGTSTSTAG